MVAGRRSKYLAIVSQIDSKLVPGEALPSFAREIVLAKKSVPNQEPHIATTDNQLPPLNNMPMQQKKAYPTAPTKHQTTGLAIFIFRRIAIDTNPEVTTNQNKSAKTNVLKSVNAVVTEKKQLANVGLAPIPIHHNKPRIACMAKYRLASRSRFDCEPG